MIEFLWKSNLLIAVLYAVYRFLLRDLSFFMANRVILLLIPMIAVAFAFIPPSFSERITTIYVLPELLTNANELSLELAEKSSDQMPLITVFYILGFAISFLVLLFRISTLLIFLRNNKGYQEEGYYIVSTESETPSFSFFNIIHINALHSNAKTVVQHEKLHHSRFHSVDNLYLEILKCVFWFNPLIHLIHKELRSVHEFEVDQALSPETDYEAELIGTNAALKEIVLTNSYKSNTNLLKRLKMMRKNKSNPINVLRYLFFAPALMLSLFILSCTEPKGEEGDILEKNVENAEVLSTPEQLADISMPSYPGGNQALIEFLSHEIKYPESAKKAGISGKVFISFVVSEDGSLDEVEVKKGVNSELDNEAVRAVKSMPNWIPGEKDGQKVAVAFGLPIVFSLE